MGARISIQFANGNETSPVLFSHWGGEEFLDEANTYLQELKAEQGDTGISYPLDRLEPRTVMVDFIRYITKGMNRVSSNLYLGVDENDGDNSDYGHHVIDLASEASLPVDFENIANNYINGNLKDFRIQVSNLSLYQLADFTAYCQENYSQLTAGEIAKQLKLMQ